MRVVITAFVLLVVVCGRAEAQTTVLTGRVGDAQGAAMAGVDVQVLREDGAVAHRTVTDAAGVYRFGPPRGGRFVVVFEKGGFRRQVRTVSVGSDRPTTLDATLEMAGLDEAVVVTASGLPQAAQETSKAITIIDAREIRDRNEATLTEIVRYTPGVQVRDVGGPGQLGSMRIRGLRPDAAAVLIDGLRFRDASTLQGDATSFLSNLNFIATDRVEVLRGAGSSLYGTNAVGGVVNIVSSEGSGPMRGEAQVEGGSLGHTRVRGSVSGGARDNRVTYSLGGLQWNVRQGLDGDDAYRSTGGQALVRFHLSSATSLTARVLGSTDRVHVNTSPSASGIPSANIPDRVVVDAIPVAREQIERANAGLPFDVGGATFVPARNDPDDTRESWFQTSALQFKQARSERMSWNASYQRVHTSRSYLGGPLGTGFQPPARNVSRYAGDIDTGDVRAILQPAPWVTVTAGYEFEREQYRERQDNNLPGDERLQTEAGIVQQAHTGFAAVQVTLLDRRLHVSLSGRTQAFRLGSVDLSSTGTTSGYDNVAARSLPRALTGDVSAAYFFGTSNTKLRVHAGNAYRAPALYERFGGGFSNDPITGEVGFTPFGDPLLEPDRYRSIDMGVDQGLWRDRVQLSVSAFYIDVRSLTAFDFSGGIRPETDPYGRTSGYVNGSGGFSRGLEFGLDARPLATLRLSASYAYTRAETETDVTIPDFRIMPGVFTHTASFVATRYWGDRVHTTLDLFHGSGSYAPFFAAGRTRAYLFPAFTRASVVGSYRLSPGEARAVRAYVKVDNLFDATYYQGGWRAMGRTAMAGLTVGF